MSHSQLNVSAIPSTVDKSAEAKSLVDEINQVAKLINTESSSTLKIADIRSAAINQRFVNRNMQPKLDRLVYQCTIDKVNYIVKVQRIDLAHIGTPSSKRPPNYANELRALLRSQGRNITPRIHLAQGIL